MDFAATAESHEQLGFTLFEVDFQRYQRETFFVGPAGKALDFAAVQEQLSPASRGVIKVSRLLVLGNVAADEIDFAVLHAAVGLFKRNLSRPQAFDLASVQDETAFQRFDDLVFVPRTAVLCDKPLVVVLAIDGRFLRRLSRGPLLVASTMVCQTLVACGRLAGLVNGLAQV